MIRIEGPESPNGNNGEANYEMFRISKAEVGRAWRELTRQHLPPSRLITLGFGFESATDEERDHLRECDNCRTYYEAYGSSVQETNEECQSIFPCDESKLRASASNPTLNISQETVCDSYDGTPCPAPSILRDNLYVSGPILFPNQEIAFNSWQFGRLIALAREKEKLADGIIDTIAQRAFAVVESDLGCESAIIVCFGNAMHRCGVRLAMICDAKGMGCPHVVLAHDYYSPAFVCDQREFLGANVFVLVDVVHSGQMLQRLIGACQQLNPRRVKGIAVIGQTEDAQFSVLWTEKRESRLPLTQFQQVATAEEYDGLQRFEPNDECGVAPAPIAFPKHSSSAEFKQPVALEADLLHHIHETGALKRDYTICGKRYPYVVNVIDMIKKDTKSRQFILASARNELADLMSQKVCLAYHAGRFSRAGVIAKALSTDMQWPVVPIGRSGSAFSLTDKQYRRLGSYATVVIVDAAIRTGESASAILQALSDPWLRQRSRLIAFFVLDALSHRSREDLLSESEVEIRTLFKLPMSPPTEEIRHWANKQKSLVLRELNRDPRFESLRRALGNYCDPPVVVRRVSCRSRSIAQTSIELRAAVYHAESLNNGKTRVHAACQESKPHLIRHLSLDEVVHDRSVQDLLIGVMYNSMKPSFKESAALALAAARNYEWMTLEWLRCNKPFLTSSANSWKAILLIECEMRLNDRKEELAQFRNAATILRGDSYDQCSALCAGSAQRQLPFPCDDNHGLPWRDDARSQEDELQRRLSVRLDSYIEAAG